MGEIIIAGFLIVNNELDVVKASITGSIVGNLLLVLGASLFVGGLKNGIQRYDAQATGMNAASLILATIGLIVPATFAAILNAGAETGEGSPSSSTWRSCRSAWPWCCCSPTRRRPTSTFDAGGHGARRARPGGAAGGACGARWWCSSARPPP